MIPVLPRPHNKRKPLAAKPNARCWRSASGRQQLLLTTNALCAADARRAFLRLGSWATGLLAAPADGKRSAGRVVAGLGRRQAVCRQTGGCPGGRCPGGRAGGPLGSLSAGSCRLPASRRWWVACRCRPPATCRLRSAAASLVTPSGRPCRGCPSPRSS